jgi:large subunit ribosomal protein L24
MNIKKKDTVLILTGKDAGEMGEIRKILPEKSRVIVTGRNMITKHAKPSQGKPGGIQKQEGTIHISNVELVCPKCKKACRPKSGRLESGEKIRICRKCGETIL